MPVCEYFQTNGIGVPELYQEQRRYLLEAVTDYVVTVGRAEYVHDTYDEVASGELEGSTYYLWKRKTDESDR